MILAIKNLGSHTVNAASHADQMETTKVATLLERIVSLVSLENHAIQQLWNKLSSVVRQQLQQLVVVYNNTTATTVERYLKQLLYMVHS